jgi:hypothetical protein
MRNTNGESGVGADPLSMARPLDGAQRSPAGLINMLAVRF